MLKNFLKVALRTIRRNKVYSIINIMGLAIGLACAILILLWVQDELNYNSYHRNINDIYGVMENQNYEDRIGTTFSTPGPLGPYLKTTYPEVEHSSRLTWESENLFSVNDQSFYEMGRYVDEDFFSIFTFEFLHGNAEDPFTTKTSLVLTEKLAQKYFPDEDPIGKTIKLNNDELFTVTGVVKKWPDNTSNGDFDYLVNFEYFWDENKNWLDQWGNNNVRCFIQLNESVNWEEFSHKLTNLLDEKNDDNAVQLFLHPLSNLHLYSSWDNGVLDGGGRIRYVRIFTIIAFFILMIACINFMNLATAQAVKRAKEVGLRKVVGAVKSNLIFQFLSESVVFAIFSGLIAIGLVILLLEPFNLLTQKAISFDLDPSSGVILLLLVLITGLASGSYPAFYISRFQPASVLKGQIKSGQGAVRFRKALVTTQFVLSIIMIFCTIVVYQQLVYAQNLEIGFNKEGLIYVEMHQDMNDKYEVIKDQLMKNPDIKMVTAMSMPPLGFGNSTWGFDWPGKDPQSKILFSNLSIDNTFTETFEIPLAAGRSFDPKFTTDTLHFMVNVAGATAMGFTPDEVVDQPVTLWGERHGKVIGVFEDFNFTSTRSKIRPLLMLHDPDWLNHLIIRAQPGKNLEAINILGSIYQEFAPAYPFEYTFVDARWNEFYENEARTAKLFNTFAFVAIFISCLGLFGLAAFSIQQRTKEIGVRKVLGASVFSIIRITTKEFAIMILLAALIGSPVAWYLMDMWLEDFAFRIDVTLAIPVITTLIAIAVAILTVSYHALRASSTNPVNALKFE
ncbi:MAG: ABC transporter permease [Marinoscillum sp.]